MADDAVKVGNHIEMRGRSIRQLADGVDPADAVNVGQMEEYVATHGGSGGGPGSGYTLQDYEKTSSFVYVGYEDVASPTPGAWFIYRRTIASNVRQSASGGSGYAAGWSGRAGLTYA